MKEKICFFTIILISVIIVFILYNWPYHGPGEYHYQGVRTSIIYKNVSIEKEILFDFLSTNPNITIEQISIHDENHAPFDHIRFRHTIWNQTHSNHNFVIWMESDILNSDFTISFSFYSKANIHGEKREDVDKESEDLFIKDKQISENITKDMVNEFFSLVKKEPEPFEFKKMVIKPPTM